MRQWLIDNIPLIITSIFGSGSFFAYHTEKKKRKIEEKQIGADALKTMQEGYDKFTENAMEQYDTLRKEVGDLKKRLTDVSTELEEEKEKYNKLKNSYDSLKREFDNYKKKHNNI